MIAFALLLLAAPADDAARKQRMEELLGPPTADGAVGEERPDPLRLRSPWIASALGGAAGFGTGAYYAGNNARGFLMTGVDAALWVGLAVVDRDSGSAVGALVTGLVISHLFQAVTGALDAQSTNRTLEGYSFVPLPSRPAR
ncbi:MAG: hypothetical protein AAFX94_12275 [Myxococcota bacterium]